MDRARFEELARTVGLGDLELAVSATIRPGTLAFGGPAPVAKAITGATLPRLDLASKEPGQQGGELELVSLLGEGGMGAVWLARQRSLARDVAVKRLRRAPGSTSDVSALLVEARVTGALAHPGVVPVHALGLDADGSPLLVMKPVEGASLEALVREPAHPAWPALERRHGDRLAAYVQILMHVADALDFAHSRRVVHRDVKPENVMVGAFGEVYLLDWGIALARQGAGTTDEVRSIVGTPVYMAPEMVGGESAEVDARTDVYLLGATLHAVLTGAPRHAGTTLQAVLVAAMESEPVPYGPEVPLELAALANRATHRDRTQRPPTALAFRDALGAFLRHRGSTRLAETAARTLASLEREGGGPCEPTRLASAEGTARLAEARFGFTQALREWPENDGATAGLRRAVGLAVEAELHRRSPDAAAALASLLVPRDPELERRIAILSAEQAESRALADAARIDAHERDPSVARGERTVLLLAVLGITVLIASIGAASAASVGRLPSMEAVLAWDLAVFVLLAVPVVALRARLFQNRWSRTAGAFVFLGIGLRVLTDVIALSRGDATETMAPYGILVLAGGIAAMAFVLTPRLWVPAAVGALGALASAAWPMVGLPAMVGTIVVTAVVILEASRARPDG